MHLFWPPFWIFPSHVSLTCLTLEHSQAEKLQHTAPGFNLPLSLRLPVYVSLCPRLQLRPAPITIPHQHIYCTCLLAPCHSYTVLLHLVREQDGREEKKKDKASQKIYRKWLLMLRSSRSDLQWEHPGVSWEAQIQYHSFGWLGALCNPINRFLWKPPTLWWAIKAYLHSVPLKGSEAPERSCVWSDISVSLHSLLCCHDLGYTIKKTARTRAWIQWHHPDHISHICELPLLPLFI